MLPFVTRRRPDRLGGPTTESVAIAVDVGATKIAAGVVDGRGVVLHRHRHVATPAVGGELLLDVLEDIVVLLRGKHPEAVGIGIGIAGLVDHGTGAVGFAGNHTHRALSLRDDLRARVGLPVVVDNDANTAVWAEAVATGSEDVLFLALGTGLGSGLVSEGRLLRGGRDGRGIEIGHLTVDPQDGRQCPCGGTGCLELTASGRVLFEGARRIVVAEPDGMLAELGDSRRGPLTVVQIRDAVRKGDPAVASLVDGVARTLGRAIVTAVLPWFGVERVAIGGALAELDDVLLEPLRRECETGVRGHHFLQAPKIERAHHRHEAALVGAGLMLLAQPHDPELRHPRVLPERSPVVAVDRTEPAVSAPAGSQGTVLHVSPHPDDESIGAPCTLLVATFQQCLGKIAPDRIIPGWRV